MSSLGSLKRSVRVLARRQFKGVDIQAVRLAPDVGSDGDPIMRVQIVFDARSGELEPRAAINLISLIQSELEKAG